MTTKKESRNLKNLLLSPTSVLRSSEGFEGNENTIKNKLFFYPLNPSEISSKNFALDFNNPFENNKIVFQKIEFLDFSNKNRKRNYKNNNTQDDILLSPRNRNAINKANIKSIEYNDNKPMTSRLNILEMTTTNPSERRETEYKDLTLNSFNKAYKEKQISDNTKTKLNNIYQLAGQELG